MEAGDCLRLKLWRDLQHYAWPGNIRELRNVVERLLLLAGERVDAGMVADALPHAGTSDCGLLGFRLPAIRVQVRWRSGWRSSSEQRC